MVSDASSSDWLASQVLVFDRKIERQKKWVWSPIIWKLILLGIPVILLWGILGVFVPVIIAEVRYQAQSTSQNFQNLFPQGMVPKISMVILPEWVGKYALEIPKLGVREQVVESVNAANEDEYTEALKEGIAHARGTGLPGAGGIQYYFAHSSGLPFWGDRAVVFALLYKLEPGDQIIIYRDSQKYRYAVKEKRVVMPEDIGLLISQDMKEQVVLQTCWPIGTSWKRLLVIAESI